MIDSLIRDSLKLANEVIENSSNTNSINTFWIWIAITEFLVIIFLLFKQKKKVKETVKSKLKTDSLKGEIDFHNIIDSSFNSQKLYDELKVKCHPDRFPTDNEMNKIADSLFQEINKNKTNTKRLIELKEEAKQKLNIYF
jgi:hypothetical protein